ncbi:hypothetical protein J2S98_004551 [Arthrobacter oryzae]|nr:hypothetical protein [Arthrobacter oryzae]
MFAKPVLPAPLILAAKVLVSGSGLQVTFDLLQAPRSEGVYVVGLRAGDEGRHPIRHLTVSLDRVGLRGMATYDFLTGTRTVHPLSGACYSGTTVIACFPQASLVGLGAQPGITAFSSLNGHALQTDLPVDTPCGHFPCPVGATHKTGNALRAVEAAAALNAGSGFDQEHSAPALQSAVAHAVLQGLPIADVAAAAHMTPLEVLDATDAAGHHGPYAKEGEDMRTCPCP